MCSFGYVVGGPNWLRAHCTMSARSPSQGGRSRSVEANNTGRDT